MTTNIGLVFDFDDTLAPDSTTFLLEKYDVDPESFWFDEFQSRVQNGYDPTVAYQTLLLDKIGENRPLGRLGADDLNAVGADLDDHLFDGLPSFFESIGEIANGYESVDIECYIISEGLAPIIRETKVTEYCEAVYGSRLATDDNDVIDRISRPISFTDKTRYLFEINKGIDQVEAERNPYSANKLMETESRHIPFESMIYVGDGITDIPCFSLVKQRNGRAFGVMDEDDCSTKQQAILDLGSPRRAGNLNKPAYSESSRLGSLLRLTIEGMCTDRTIDELEAL
jgi:phosphoserine phosphatase